MSIREKPNAKRHDEAIFDQTRPDVTLVAILAVFRERPRYPQPLYYGNIMATKNSPLQSQPDSGAMGSSDNPACRPQCLQDQGALEIQVRSGCRRCRHGIRVRPFLHHRPKDK